MRGNSHVRLGERCGCREPHPCCSGGMFVFVEEVAEAVVSVDA
jgi:hypothetical protein